MLTEPQVVRLTGGLGVEVYNDPKEAGRGEGAGVDEVGVILGDR